MPGKAKPPQPSGSLSSGILPDVLAPGLSVVFCGSAAGRASARIGAYYAGPGNRFWPTLHEVGLTPKRLQPQDFRALTGYGLGLTDLCKTAAGADHELPAGTDDPRGLERKIERYQPKFLAFVGKRAAAAYFGRPVALGPQADRIGFTRTFVLPSPSGAARRYWDIRPWQALAALAGKDGH